MRKAERYGVQMPWEAQLNTNCTVPAAGIHRSSSFRGFTDQVLNHL